MFFDIMENIKNRHKSLIINSRRTPSKKVLSAFDDFFACFMAQKPLYLHLQGRFSNGLQSHLYGIEISLCPIQARQTNKLQSHLYGIEIRLMV